MNNSSISYRQKENRLHESEARWFVIYTKYKSEKYVVDRLRRKGIEAYVPLLSYTKRWTRKIKHYEVPLINCYVFVKIVKDDYVKVLETEHVSGFLKNRGNLNEVRNEEIEVLRKIVGEREEILAETLTYIQGEKVEVISGNLTGLKGILVEERGKNEFVVELTSIGYQFRINIDKRHLRRHSSRVA